MRWEEWRHDINYLCTGRWVAGSPAPYKDLAVIHRKPMIVPMLPPAQTLRRRHSPENPSNAPGELLEPRNRGTYMDSHYSGLSQFGWRLGRVGEGV